MPIASVEALAAGSRRFDVLVVGAGPAGLAIADELRSTDLKVAVLDSGGTTRDPDADRLNDFESIGQARAPHDAVGCRALGGASNLWTGRCGALDAIDYRARPWLPASGWPIDGDILAPFYARAGRFLGLSGARNPDVLSAELAQGFDVPSPDGSLFQPVVWEFSVADPGNTAAFRHLTDDTGAPLAVLQHSGAPKAVNAGQSVAPRIAESANVHLFLHATAEEVRIDPAAGRVRSVVVRGQDGARFDVEAPRVVLACGGIQNARLLLASRSDRPAGLGNDNVGRYLADHTFTELASFGPRDATAIRRRLGSRWHREESSSRVFSIGWRLSAERQRENGLVNAAIHMVEFGGSTNSLSRLAEGARALRRRQARAAGREISAALARPVDLALATRDRFMMHHPPLNHPDRVVVGCVTEQPPDPESRVMLSDRMDAFGQPLARIDWRVSEREYATVCAVEVAFHAEATRLGAPLPTRPDLTARGFEAWRAGLIDLAHPSCTTRMSACPSAGVVDTDCQVHGIAGLYVAGSSVFATNGHMNPTQTLVALAIRLADHLKARSPRTLPATPRSVGSPRLRVGFIGGGDRVSRVYRPVVTALQDLVEVCGVATRTQESADRVSESTGWPAWTDMAALVRAATPDLLVVVVPPGVVEDVYPRVSELGVPLLLETPFAWNGRRGDMLLQRLRSTRRLVGVAEQFPFLPEVRLQRRLIELGLLGRVDAVVNDFAVYNYHGIAMARALLGWHRVPHSAQATHLQVGGGEKWLCGTVRFRDGALLDYRYATTFPRPVHRDVGFMKVYGTHGTLLPGEVRLQGSDGGTIVSLVTRSTLASGALRRIAVETPDGEVSVDFDLGDVALDDEQVAVASLLKGMVDAVRHGSAPLYTAEAANEDIRLLNALEYSAGRAGARLRFPYSHLRQKVLLRARRAAGHLWRA